MTNSTDINFVNHYCGYNAIVLHDTRDGEISRFSSRVLANFRDIQILTNENTASSRGKHQECALFSQFSRERVWTNYYFGKYSHGHAVKMYPIKSPQIIARAFKPMIWL